MQATVRPCGEGSEIRLEALIQRKRLPAFGDIAAKTGFTIDTKVRRLPDSHKVFTSTLTRGERSVGVRFDNRGAIILTDEETPLSSLIKQVSDLGFTAETTDSKPGNGIQAFLFKPAKHQPKLKNKDGKNLGFGPVSIILKAIEAAGGEIKGYSFGDELDGIDGRGVSGFRRVFFHVSGWQNHPDFIETEFGKFFRALQQSGGNADAGRNALLERALKQSLFAAEYAKPANGKTKIPVVTATPTLFSALMKRKKIPLMK